MIYVHNNQWASNRGHCINQGHWGNSNIATVTGIFHFFSECEQQYWALDLSSILSLYLFLLLVLIYHRILEKTILYCYYTINGFVSVSECGSKAFTKQILFFASKRVKMVIPKPSLSKTSQNAFKEIPSHVSEYRNEKSQITEYREPIAPASCRIWTWTVGLLDVKTWANLGNFVQSLDYLE